jgi:hypothetical protein
MKPLTINLILILTLLGLASHLEAQTSHAAAAPVFLNHIYYSQPDSLISLEQNAARWNPKQRNGLRGSEGGFYRMELNPM